MQGEEQGLQKLFEAKLRPVIHVMHDDGLMVEHTAQPGSHTAGKTWLLIMTAICPVDGLNVRQLMFVQVWQLEKGHWMHKPSFS